MTDKRMYPNDGGLKSPVRSWEQMQRESWDRYRSFFGLSPINQPFLPFQTSALNEDRTVRCRVCNIPFTDSMGRSIAMGYVCSNTKCPSGVTC